VATRDNASAPAAILAYVSLGSNLGDRAAHLARALAALSASPGIELRCCSSIRETEPVGPPQGRYLNAVCGLTTRLPARTLLARLLEIERSEGRSRSGVRNEPRTLDLDLLLYGDARIDEPDLRVPHPRLHERAFVLEPLCEIAPDLIHPELGQTIRALFARVSRGEARRRS
jgi:2-amino-4-hydroxy-6-hydroxymethyldihydropteridine diphosphokinase